jgi:hypothetical protein
MVWKVFYCKANTQAITLDLATKRAIAMTIMHEVSLSYESLQYLKDSHYEISDLPSNVLGLYQQMYHLDETQLNDLLKPLSINQSLTILSMYPNTFGFHTAYMNRTFKPILFNNPFGSGEVPAIFQSVQPKELGVPFESDFFIPQ